MARFLLNPGKHILVIEVGKACLKVVSFLCSVSKIELLDYSLERLSPEADVAGQITGSLRAFLKKNSLSVKEAVLSIADADAVAIRYCLLPALSRKEILSAAIWQLKDEVHFDLEHAYSDWRVVKEFTDEQGARQQGVIFAFSRKEAVEKYLACLSGCNLSASAIVTSAFNYISILKGAAKDKPYASEIVLDLEYTDSALNLYIDKKLHFTRYLPVSVEGFAQALVGTLVSGAGRVELSLREAEEIRDSVGIPDDETVLIRDNLQASQVTSLMRPVLESLVREIKHSVTYFTSNLEEPQPQVIYISGLGSNLKNLDTYLAREMGFPVSRLTLPDILDAGRIQPDRLAADCGQLLSCVGAVLAAKRGVSLLAGDIRTRWIKNVLMKRLAPFVAVAGTVILSLMFISVMALPFYRYRLKQAKSYFEDKKQLFSFFEKVRLRRELVLEVSLQRVTADALLNFISRSIPDGLCLNGLELDQYRGELILQGKARQAEDMEIFLDKLRASGFFVSLQSPGQTEQAFEIRCKLKY